MQVEYVHGVVGLDPEALPPSGDRQTKIKDSALGAWRAHMNAIRM